MFNERYGRIARQLASYESLLDHLGIKWERKENEEKKYKGEE